MTATASDPQIPPFPDEGRRPSPRKLAEWEQLDHLSALPLFADCSRRELKHLARSARLDQLEVGQRLFAEGQPSREAAVIVAGRVVVRRGGRTVAELGPGEIVGELGLLLDRDHEASAITLSPVEVLVLPQQALREAVEEVPGLGWKLLQTVAARMAENASGRHPEP